MTGSAASVSHVGVHLCPEELDALCLAWLVAVGLASVGPEISRFNKKSFMAQWLGPCCASN